ncbi:MAG: hypothetical protein U5K51_10445 [Flavobacteriaceae bacterium]|nr:hypothetical protein [Flavobacteriaceae bacterium]
MANPDFVKIGEGYRIQSKRVSKRDELVKAIKEMIASKEAYLLDVSVTKEDNVFPMIPTGASVSEIRLK